MVKKGLLQIEACLPDMALGVARWFFYVLRSIRRRLRLIGSINLDILVVSPGGVATTSLLEEIAQFCGLAANDPYDRDCLKHQLKPPKRLSKNTRVLYIFGNPVQVAGSLERRGYLHSQASKLGAIRYFFSGRQGREDAFNRALAHQKRAWTQLGTRCLAIHGDDMWDELPLIEDFVGLPAGCLKDHWVQVKRHTSAEARATLFREPPWRNHGIRSPQIPSGA